MEAVGISEHFLRIRQTSRRHIPEATVPLLKIRKQLGPKSVVIGGNEGTALLL
jgi:hypothetical protein